MSVTIADIRQQMQEKLSDLEEQHARITAEHRALKASLAALPENDDEQASVVREPQVKRRRGRPQTRPQVAKQVRKGGNAKAKNGKLSLDDMIYLSVERAGDKGLSRSDLEKKITQMKWETESENPKQVISQAIYRLTKKLQQIEKDADRLVLGKNIRQIASRQGVSDDSSSLSQPLA